MMKRGANRIKDGVNRVMHKLAIILGRRFQLDVRSTVDQRPVMLTSKQTLFAISESQSGLNAVCAGDLEYSLLEVSSRRQCFVHIPRAIYTRHTAERASATYHLRDPVICNISRSTAPTLPTASV